MAEKKDLKNSIMDNALGIKQSPAVKSKPKTKPAEKQKQNSDKSFLPPRSILKTKPKSQAKEPVKAKDSSSSSIVVGVVVLVVFVSLFILFNQGFVDLDGDKTGEKNDLIFDEENGNEIEDNEIPLTFDEKYAECIAESNIQKKDQCIQQIAIEFNKDALCDELINLDSRKCKREVWKAFAVVSLEINECKGLQTDFDKINCVKEIALNSSDKSICSKMPEVVSTVSPTEINSCFIELAMQEKDLTVCDEIDGSMKDTCKFGTAIAVSDPDLCNAFELATIRNDCIARIAVNNNDVSLCERITSSIQKNKCIKDLS